MKLSEKLDAFYAKEKEQFVDNPLLFSHKLGIGEKAYGLLQAKENLNSLAISLSAGTAAGVVMSTSAVASTFFAGSSWLTALGLVGASTPIGWVFGAGLAVGAGYFGLAKILNTPRKNGFIAIPKHIKTPLDLIASTFLDFFIPLGLKISWLDGHVCENEQKAMIDYLSKEWGFNRDYLEANLHKVVVQAKDLDLTEFMTRFITFAKSNPDCDLDALHRHTMAYVTVITKADGIISNEEAKTLNFINDLFIAAKSPKKFAFASSQIKSAFLTSSETAGRVIRSGQSLVKHGAGALVTASKEALPKK